MFCTLDAVTILIIEHLQVLFVLCKVTDILIGQSSLMELSSLFRKGDSASWTGLKKRSQQSLKAFLCARLRIECLVLSWALWNSLNIHVIWEILGHLLSSSAHQHPDWQQDGLCCMHMCLSEDTMKERVAALLAIQHPGGRENHCAP